MAADDLEEQVFRSIAKRSSSDQRKGCRLQLTLLLRRSTGWVDLSRRMSSKKRDLFGALSREDEPCDEVRRAPDRLKLLTTEEEDEEEEEDSSLEALVNSSP